MGDEDEDTMPKLGKVERWILSNQYRILEQLAEDDVDREHFAKVREVLECGYELNYSWVSTHIYDETLSEEECRFVLDVLDMHHSMQHAYDGLDPDDKAAITEQKVLFDGFDGNGRIESKMLGYAQFLREREEKFTAVRLSSGGLNSHTPTLARYHRMLDRWHAAFPNKHHLPKADLEALVALRREVPY